MTGFRLLALVAGVSILGGLRAPTAFAAPDRAPRPEEMVERIKPAVALKDLRLAETQVRALREAAEGARRRAKTSTRVLLSGAGNDGRRVAEALAGEAKREMWRVDLAAVVSRYAGETEKNLERLFTRAEDAGALLFFDEADALFGKRTEVKDAHDRCAGIETNFLLQRIEEYRGLVVIATNRRVTSAEAARRFPHLVKFPPD